MARTESTMLPLGTLVPAFSLPDVAADKLIDLETFSGKQTLLIMFLCRHCPYVKHVQAEIARLGREYQSKPLGILAISSNDAAAYPDDSPKSLKQQAAEAGFVFPYCYDETQDVARAFTAACTPDFFLFDQERKLAYRGQFDNSRPGNGIPVTGADVRNAIEALLSGQPVNPDQKPSIGCNIKWRPAS
jgi:peroxiredoxin